MKVSRRHFFIALCTTLAVLLLLSGMFFLYLLTHGGFTCYSMPANMRKGDDLISAQTIVLATPTGRETITRKYPDDTVSFRLVEMTVTEAIKGSPGDTIRILQTVGWAEDPVLRQGNTYLLFLDRYLGGNEIPNTEGSYVVISGSWGYYSVTSDRVSVLYDETGERRNWLNSFATRGNSAARNNDSYTVLDWLREQNP